MLYIYGTRENILPSQNSTLIEGAHHLGIQVYYWSIDDQSTMQELIELGADGIFTNRPDLLKEVISAARS